jgi:hypothetical protein
MVIELTKSTGLAGLGITKSTGNTFLKAIMTLTQFYGFDVAFHIHAEAVWTSETVITVTIQTQDVITPNGSGVIIPDDVEMDFELYFEPI